MWIPVISQPTPRERATWLRVNVTLNADAGQTENNTTISFHDAGHRSGCGRPVNQDADITYALATRYDQRYCGQWQPSAWTNGTTTHCCHGTITYVQLRINVGSQVNFNGGGNLLTHGRTTGDLTG